MKTPKIARYIVLVLLLISPVLTASALSQTTFAPGVPCAGKPLGLRGDVTGDCHLNLLDVVHLTRMIAGLCDIVPITGDVDCNRILDSRDYVILVDILFRQAPEPAPCT